MAAGFWTSTCALRKQYVENTELLEYHGNYIAFIPQISTDTCAEHSIYNGIGCAVEGRHALYPWRDGFKEWGLFLLRCKHEETQEVENDVRAPTQDEY